MKELEAANWKKAVTARRLGMSRATFPQGHMPMKYKSFMSKGEGKSLIAFIFGFLLLFISMPSIVEGTIPDIVLKQKKAVVTIYINDQDGKQIANASGFIVDSNGIIATNYHVVSKWFESLNNTILFKLENGAFYPVENIVSEDHETTSRL